LQKNPLFWGHCEQTPYIVRVIFANVPPLLQKGLSFAKEPSFLGALRADSLHCQGDFCKRALSFAEERALFQKGGHFCKREGDFAKERAIFILIHELMTRAIVGLST